MLVIKDFATTMLAAGISAVDTTITVSDGSRLPALVDGEHFFLVLQKFVDRNYVEIVKVTSISGNSLIVSRAQDGTTARSFSAGDYVELRLTVKGFSEYISQSAVSRRGSLDMLCARMWAGQTVTIGCYGDSTTDGNATTGWVANPTSGGNAVGNSDHNATAPNAWPMKLQNILREMFKNNNIKTFNAGYSGQRMDNGWALKNYSAAMVNNPYYGIPDVCFIAFGLNDIAAGGSQIDPHIDQTTKLAFRMLGEGTLPIILTCDAEYRNGQFGDTRDHKEARRELDAAKKALGDKYGFLVVDIADAQKGWIQNNNDGFKWVVEQADGLHFGNNGHAFKAQCLAARMFLDAVSFEGGSKEVNTWSSESAYTGNYTAVYKFSNNGQGGNVYYSGAAPVNADLVTIWVWNTCPHAYLVYQGIDNDGVLAPASPPSVVVKEYFSGAETVKNLSTAGVITPYRRSDEQFVFGRLRYGLNKVVYRSGNSASLFYGSFKLVESFAKIPSNALLYTGPLGLTFTKGTGIKFLAPIRAPYLSNVAGCGFAGSKISISFDVACSKEAGVILWSGQGFYGSDAVSAARNAQTSVLMFRHTSGDLRFYTLLSGDDGVYSYSLHFSVVGGWPDDVLVGRIEMERVGDNQVFTVYDSFLGGNVKTQFSLATGTVSTRWSGFVGGLYANSDTALESGYTSVNRLVINR